MWGWYVPGTIGREYWGVTDNNMGGDNSITFYAVPGGTYMFQLTNGSDWSGNSCIESCSGVTKGTSGSNATITFSGEKDITITVTNESTWKVSVTASDPTYHIKYPWDGTNWACSNAMTSNLDGTYSVVGVYHGKGFNYRKYNSDSDDFAHYNDGTKNVTEIGSPSGGDNCVFTFKPSDNSLIIRKCNSVSATSYIYFDNTIAGWSNNSIQWVVGRPATGGAPYSATYEMAAVANTNLYYYRYAGSGWSDAGYYAMIGTGSKFGDGNWYVDNLTNATKYSGAFFNKIDVSNTYNYIISKASADNGTAISMTQKGNTASALNSAQTIQYALSTDNGSSYDVMSSGSTPGTISISAYKFANGTYGSVSNTSNSQSITGNTTGTYSTSVPAAYTGETTLSASATTGYTFVGWKIGTTETTASSPCYPTEATTYTARFNANQYSITYKDKGDVTFTGTQAGAPTTHTYGIVTALKIPTKAGYTFGGWYTASDCASGAIGTAASASLGATDYTANITLYAKWYANDYSFAVSETPAENVKIDVANTILNSSTGGVLKFTPNGDGAKMYYIGGTNYLRFSENGYCNVTACLTKNMQVGSIITATIHNYGTGLRGLQLENTSGTAKANWRSEGNDLTFTYIYIVQAGDGLAGSNKFVLRRDNNADLVTLTVANCGSAHTYTLSLDDESATTSVSPGSVTTSAGLSTLSSSITNPIKTGYTFGGWYSGDDGTGTQIIDTNGTLQTNTIYTDASGNWAYGDDVTLYAKWTINSHDITYTPPTNGSYTIKAGDASAVSTNVSSVNYATTITLAATPVNGCYVFDSWTVTGATSGETIAVTNNQFSMPDEDVTVTASFVQVNLALGITPVAGYTNAGNPNEVPDKLTDGNNTTAWTTWNSSSSVPASSEWFYVDLGAYYQLSSIEISWEDGGSDYYSTDYLLQVRQTEPTLAEAADDKSWYTAAEETGAVGGGVKRTTVDVPARYVRFHSLSRHGGWLRVWEFRVFGTATTTTYTTPTLNTAEVSSYPLDYETVNLHLASTDSKGAAIHTYKITDENSNVSIVTTNGSDLVTISGLSKFDTHTLTVQAMDNGALLSESQNISVCIWDPSYNMAQGKTVVAGYTNADNTGEAPSKLTDGDTGTMWTTYLNGGSVPASDEWFYVDLGAYYQLSSIELLWGDVYSTDYLLQVRQDAPADASVQADDMQWYPVAEVSDATASSTKSTAVNIPARYVRFHSKTRSGGWLRVCEIRVYTSSFASADANVPVVATATTSYNNDGKAYLTLTATDTEDVTTNWFRIYNPSTETYSLQQTNVSNQIVIDDLPSCATYTFEVQAMDKAAKLSEVSEIEVKVPVSSLMNLALGKTTYAGYSEIGDGSKANAIDGDTGTKWSANGARADENEWFAVDLGKRYDIGKIKVLFGGSGSGVNADVTPRDFTIQTSLDNVNWADVHHYDSQPTINEWVEKNISKTWAARYVRIWVKEHTTYGMHILELEVYSKYGCYEDDGLIIYHKDDKADDVHADGYEPDGFAGGKIDGIIEYRMKVRAKDQWHALCLPFTVTAVQVWDEEDKRYYDLIPYYRSEGKYYKGHYIIRKPERKLNLPLENFGNWVDPSYQVGFLPQKDTVYIIQWHEDYYVGRYISFFGASGQTIPTSMSVGDAPEVDKVVNLYGNNAMVSGEVTDAYTLVGDYGGGAWLRNDEVGSDREVLPFECYIRANSGTTTIFNAIRRDMTFIDTPTGWDDVVNAEINRHVRVYSITGEMMEQFSDCSINEAAERVRSAYGEGLYILNTENECVKLLVGGK